MNLKEKVDRIEENVERIKSDVGYIKKMIEDFTTSLSSGKDNKDAIKAAMDGLGQVINNDPNMNKHPDIQKTIQSLFKVIS